MTGNIQATFATMTYLVCYDTVAKSGAKTINDPDLNDFFNKHKCIVTAVTMHNNLDLEIRVRYADKKEEQMIFPSRTDVQNLLEGK